MRSLVEGKLRCLAVEKLGTGVLKEVHSLVQREMCSLAEGVKEVDSLAEGEVHILAEVLEEAEGLAEGAKEVVVLSILVAVQCYVLQLVVAAPFLFASFCKQTRSKCRQRTQQ